MTTLNDNIPVLFVQAEHKYYSTKTGAELKGITSTLLRRLFPNKYGDVPQAVLDRAAEHGSLVHEDVELAEGLGTDPSTPEGRNYLQLKEKHNLVFLRSEHLVSDMEHYASSIDLIFDVEDGVVDIADIKTTSKFDYEYVSWQLSIYACLLELNNPDITVRKLYGIWLRGEDISDLVEVARHGKDEVADLMRADIEGRDYAYVPQVPGYITGNADTLRVLGRKIEELTNEYDAIKDEVLRQMSKHGDKSFDLGGIKLTLVKPSERSSFDSKKFQEDHGDLYDKYIKKSMTKESIKITLRQ